jgi:hypothetical protein
MPSLESMLTTLKKEIGNGPFTIDELITLWKEGLTKREKKADFIRTSVKRRVKQVLRHKITDEEIDLIKQRIAEGVSVRQLSQEINRSHWAIRSVLSGKRRKKGLRPLSVRGAIEEAVLVHNMDTLSKVQAHILNKTGVHSSTDSTRIQIGRYLKMGVNKEGILTKPEQQK